MKEQITKSEYRKLVKAAGFKVSFRTVGFSDLLRRSVEVQIIKNANGDELPTIFYGEAHRESWLPTILLKNQYEI